MKKILHVGAWGRNYGDLAIQRAMVEQLGSHRPTDGLTIDHVDIQTTDFDGYDFSPYDLLIVGGGGLLWDKPELGSYTGWQWRIPLRDLLAIEVPLVVYGIGFTRFPYHDPTGRRQMWAHLRTVAAKAALFSVRNSETRSLCRQHGIKAELIPDPAMFLRPPLTGLTLTADGVRPNVGGKIDRPIIGLCWASDKPKWRFGTEDRYSYFLHEFAVGLRDYVKEIKGVVLMIEHIADLDAEARAIFHDVLDPYLTSVEESAPHLYPATLSEVANLASLYGECSVVFSARKHGIWLAAGQGVPTVPLGEVREVQWTANSVGTGRYAITLSDIANAESTVGLFGGLATRHGACAVDGLRDALVLFNSKVMAFI